MRWVAWLLAGLAASLASAAVADPNAPPRPTVITNPDWAQRPDADDLAEQYPAVAQFIGLGGKVQLHCIVATDGSVACQLEEETPAGMGFGDAALAFSKTFKMKPMLRDGKPVAGGVVTIPIKFSPSAEDAEGASPAVEAAVAALAPGALPANANVSPRSTELARKIASITLGQSSIKPLRDVAREELIQQFGGAKLTAAEKAAVEDYVEALAATMDTRIAATADGYAQLFSEKELVDIDGFFESASGHAWLDKSQRYTAKVAQNLQGDVQAEARKRFCAQFACLSSPGADATGPTSGSASPPASAPPK
jgi:TonB family protein